MRYYKKIESGYITAIGTGAGGTEITEKKYNELLAHIGTKPEAAAGFDYKLKSNLEWELYELPPVDDEEISDAQAIDIILGGAI